MSYISKIQLLSALKKIAIPQYVYHGSAPDDILDILMHGLLTRNDRDGISVSTKYERAKDWAGLKRYNEVIVFRIPSKNLKRFEPENAYPADPKYDFTTDKAISPNLLEVKEGSKWLRLIDKYSELLSDDEYKEWISRYGQDQ